MVMSLPLSTFFWLFIPMSLLIVFSLINIFMLLRKERLEEDPVSIPVSENLEQIKKTADVRGS